MPEKNKNGMIVRSLFSALFALLGCAAVAAVVYVCVNFPGQPPMLLTQPKAAKNTLKAMTLLLRRIGTAKAEPAPAAEEG